MLPAPAQVLTRWLTERPSAPIITYYGGDGARVELSAATTANAVHKAVNLFADELLLDPGDVVWLGLPCHWQAPIIAMGAWAAGLTVAVGPRPPAGTAATLSDPDAGVDAVGAALAVSLHPWGLPLGPAAPAGWDDFAALARSQPDAAVLRWPDSGQPWLLGPGPGGAPGLTGPGLAELSARLATAWSLTAGGGLLSSLRPDRAAGLLACTLVPASVAGRVILADGADEAQISQQERNQASASDV